MAVAGCCLLATGISAVARDSKVRQEISQPSSALTGQDSEGVTCRLRYQPKSGWPEARQVERECLERLEGQVHRMGEVLELRLASGSVKRFEDNTRACRDGDAGKCVRYKLESFLPAHNTFVVRASGYDGFGDSDYLLVDSRSGRLVNLRGFPEYSPDGARFVSLSECAPFCDTKVEVWSVRFGKTKLEWKREFGALDEGTSFEGWDGTDRFRIRLGSGAFDGRTRSISFVRSGSKWRLKGRS